MEGGGDHLHCCRHHNNFPFLLLEKKEDEQDQLQSVLIQSIAASNHPTLKMRKVHDKRCRLAIVQGCRRVQIKNFFGANDSRTTSAKFLERTDMESVAQKVVKKMENCVGLKRSREVTRCSGSEYRKKIRLIGFRCRCGEVSCSTYKYSDRHDCSYDYKSADRETIARENLVVRAAKILKV
ncbi:zinc finger A20 and AN1 domain-containing stress-associated protein 5-like [Forsythia ovata]|uniref:Zinc finger A20 and AN1 domain-containing stress-associated protein 5-like n=1 Tax=Forsythia ovata TaxID=205694 RepID=A0ABD1USH5_9LAMI